MPKNHKLRYLHTDMLTRVHLSGCCYSVECGGSANKWRRHEKMHACAQGEGVTSVLTMCGVYFGGGGAISDTFPATFSHSNNMQEFSTTEL